VKPRSIALLLPVLALIGLIGLIGLSIRSALKGGAKDEVAVSPSPRAEEKAPIRPTLQPNLEEQGIWRVSHDWIEIDPEVLRRRQEARRKTFGFDGYADPADTTDCADSNCRACLIDFVYGREF